MANLTKNRYIKVLDSISIDSTKWYQDGDGNVRVPVIIAKTGVLDYKYVDQNGKEMDLREAKLPEELLSKHTIFSAEGKPVTNEHPPMMLNSSNYAQYSKGTFINPKVVGDSIHGEIVIYDRDLQDDIRSGERYQVSPGFWSSTEYVKGKYNGASYDAVQRDISINHIAIVKEGRAGESVKIKLDSKEITKMKGVLDMSPEEQKKIDEYEASKAASETPPKKDGDSPDEKKTDEDIMPPEKKKEDEDQTPDEKKKDDDTSPEAMMAMIEQLQKENELLKSQLKTDSAGKYMESRDFALKFVTDTLLNPYHDSAEYYKRAVVKAAGFDSQNLSKPQLEGAYSVAKIALQKQHQQVSNEGKMDAGDKSELAKALAESEKSNSVFSGKRSVEK